MKDSGHLEGAQNDDTQAGKYGIMGMSMPGIVAKNKPHAGGATLDQPHFKFNLPTSAGRIKHR